ncbi:MAG: Lrp/AsnC family transcriptional regulator [Candidatus Altiarchaeota archaeon]|nr:Lrp/AsnC family transcriptional regulator [Candidatus Altiarchaeota archaeon]
MDKKDVKIVQLLLVDGRIKLKAIAKKLGLPITTVYNRLKRLEKEGVMKIRAILDWKKIGYGIEAYIFINIDTASKRVNQEKLSFELAKLPGVLSVSVVTGSRDMVVRAVARDMDELSELILRKLRDFDGVASTETLVVLKHQEADMVKLIR